MPTITITLTDTPAGGVSVHSSFSPAVGKPCSLAQSAALEIMARTRKLLGLPNAVAAPTPDDAHPCSQTRATKCGDCGTGTACTREGV